MSCEELMRKLMEQMHLNTKLYQLHMRIEVKQNVKKTQLELLIKVVDYMIQKFGLAKEVSDMFDEP